MKKQFKLMTSFLLLVAVVYGTVFYQGSNVSALIAGDETCKVNVKSGWNLVSLVELICGILVLEESPESKSNFPSYLDIYAYDGSQYTHGRVYKDRPIDDSLENAALNFLNKRVEKITDGQYSDFNTYFNDTERVIEARDTSESSALAARLAREVFTSVWVYNPSKEFTVSYTSQYDGEESVMISSLNLAFGDITRAEYEALTNYAESLSGEIARELKHEPGIEFFLKSLFSGKVAVDRGWNFMTYSRVLANSSEKIDLSSGNCNITKAYVFDNSGKKWVNLSEAGSSMLNSGMVVYNDGGLCALKVKNPILDTIGRLLGGGTVVIPPNLPN